MLKSVLILFALILNHNLFASNVKCSSIKVDFVLHQGVAQICKDQFIETNYIIKTCNDQTGTLKHSNRTETPIYNHGLLWLSQLDTINFDQQIVVRQSTTIEPNFTQFNYIKSTFSINGDIINEIECPGVIVTKLNYLQ